MGILSDIAKGLPISAIQEQKIKDQERLLSDLVAENKELKERLSRYEAAAGELCPSCRKPFFTLESKAPNAVFGSGVDNYLFSCSVCGFNDSVTAHSAGTAWRMIRGESANSR